MPYFSVEMSNGTPCDINGKLRKSYVLYVCHLSANNEVKFTSCLTNLGFFLNNLQVIGVHSVTV